MSSRGFVGNLLGLLAGLLSKMLKDALARAWKGPGERL